MKDCLSIVIPTKNAAAGLEATLTAVAGRAIVKEVVVADGGSTDATVDQANAAGARVVTAEGGRGPQLARGAEAASGAWLLFLHGDTKLGPGWDDAVRRHVGDPANVRRAACFRFALDDTARAARRLERVVAWRTRRLGLPYGDQGMLISRAFYDEIGGFRPLALMEDVDLVRRIGRGRLVAMDCPAVTSARRYRESGYLWRSGRNLACLALYFLGLSPAFLARIYG